MKHLNSTESYLLSMLYFFIGKILIKLIPGIPSFEIIFFRAIISLAICSYIIHQKRVSFFGSNRKDLFLRGFFGAAGMLTFFYSLQHLPLATATALINLSPIFTVIFAGILLGEKTKNQDLVLFFIAFVGVMVLKGFDGGVSMKDFFIGILSAIFSSIAYTYIRKLKDKEDPHVIVFSLSFVAAPVFLPLMIKYWVTPTSQEWVIMIFIGIAIQSAQTLMTRAHQTSKTASSIMHYTYLDVVASTIAGYLFFSEAVSVMTVAGIMIILCSVYFLRKSHKKISI